jgi:hypothetical protein
MGESSAVFPESQVQALVHFAYKSKIGFLSRDLGGKM